ncbi:T9SS type B sorting domain-containing protein [Neolewinella aurantiaca]|uniref:T9SS type B sorting domain-containing protein n=1 Tax=Neolewinella aurantiaca TaxID=2602767 RepID=A0A5C7FYJ9_9BACT|nr:gliding motility-associated C-terminal domain-containing protein [Neolewinella aurantiaca]TXF91676.1 T9SS type B sorting domain-containing protein [Neolewinella aurantiaca]
MRYLYLVFGLLCGASAFAQTSNSTTFILPDVEGDNNAEVCLPVTAINFSSGVEFSFALQWTPPQDGGALTFNRVDLSNSALPNLDMDDFNLTDYVAAGLITVQWGNYENGESCEDRDGTVTLDDGEILFEVCFQVSGAIATNHPVEFFNLPDDPFTAEDESVDIIFNKPPQCNTGNDAFPGNSGGSVTVGVKPFKVTVEEPDGIFLPGDVVCMDVVTESGFENIKAFQVGLNFDSTILRSVSVDVNTSLPQHSNSTYQLYEGTSVFGVWAPFGVAAQNLPEGTTLFTACFEVIGECAERTDVIVDDVEIINPSTGGTFRAFLEATSEANPNDVVIPVIGDGFRFIIDNCNPDGFDVVVDCPDVEVNFGDTEVCVLFRAGDDFSRMTDIDYLINWDPTVLEFDRVDQRNPTMNIDAGNNGDFEYDRTGDGVLGFDWSANGSSFVNLNEGDVTFAVCFNAIGFGGTSPIVISDWRNEIESRDGFFDGLNPTNCAVTVQQPDGVAVSFEDEGFTSTADNCTDITVTGFSEVTGFTLYVFAPDGTLDYRSFTSVIPGVTAVEISPGLLQLTYPAGSPEITIPDGGVLGTTCYRAQETAAPGDCTEFGLADPTFIGSMVFTTESGTNSVEVEAFNAEACVLFPNGFGLIVGDAEGVINDELCVPVSVTRFTDVTRVAAAFEFDQMALSYESVTLNGNWPGLTITDFEISNAGLGVINLNWSSPTPVGEFIADLDTVQVFEICFTTGAEDGCTEVEPVDGSVPAVVTAAGEGSIIYRTGEVCLMDRLELISITAVDASCAGEDDGMIIYEVAPRPNNEDITIRTDNPVRFSSDGTVGGLLPGVTNYVLYNASGSVRLEGSITIGVNPDNAAVADAGDDGQLSCGENPSALINGRNIIGETYSLFIVNSDGVSTRFVSDGDVNGGSFVTLVNDPGTYIVEVTSEAGCTDRDTVIIAPASNPIADANDDGDVAINCEPGGTMLTCDGSSEGNNVTYLWERVTIMGEVIAAVGNTCTVNVTDPGRYRLTVTFADLGCSETDMVIVSDENDLPNSTLSGQEQLNCDGSPAVLSVGPAEENVVYTWTQLGSNAPISAGPTYTTDQLGTYVVLLQDTTTACTVSDTVEVIPSVGVPSVTFPADQTISCNPDTTVLQASYTNTVDGSTRYAWSSDDGGRVVITDLSLPNPRITRAGTYKVVISNGACRDSATVTVGEPALPRVRAGDDDTLLCTEDYQLTGDAMSLSGNSVSYQWFSEGVPVPMGSAASVVVNQPGTYVLEATDEVTGCVGMDSVVLLAPTGFPEYTLADTIGGLGCDPTTVTLRIQGESVAGYDLVWTDPLGVEIGTTSTVSTGEPGTHFISVTNPASGCSVVDSVIVIDDGTDTPFVSFRQNTLDITCESGRAIIDASGSSQGSNIEYIWSNVTDGEEPATQNNDTLRVGTAGTYRLTVVNLVSQCSSSRDVVVTDSRVFPEVEAVEGMTLDCDLRMTTIGINILDQPNDYTIQWTGGNPDVVLPRDTNRIVITEGGTYNAVVINPTTSCVTIVPIQVEDLIDSIATLSIMEPDSFDCNNTTITIDASETELNNADPSGIVWSSFDGNNITPASGSLIVSVDGPGDYELAVTDISGCTIRDTVTVVAANDTPFAQAGEPQEIECGEMLQLDGSGSTPDPVPGILYEWTASNGGNILEGGENSVMPFVDAPGTYTLVVSNLNNGCADTSVTTVTLSTQTAADAGNDRTSCDPTVVVTGNLPGGTTGEWTAFNDENSTWSAEGDMATVTEIGDGLSLVWTLSAGLGCENYSADTVFVGPEETPVANDDVLTLGGDDNIGTIDLKDNDQRTGTVTINLLNEPAFGEVLSNLNGEITFEAPIGFNGETTIDYEICSTICDNLCSQATLTIFSDADGTEPTVYNAITPNGDGMNEQFIFTKLQRNPEDFPDNELIIFNRWGDIIYEAKPYNNDWTGENNSGGMVPEGTYYYILRLNVGEGDIIRGDVTVIR